jgi:hypothetical protein
LNDSSNLHERVGAQVRVGDEVRRRTRDAGGPPALVRKALYSLVNVARVRSRELECISWRGSASCGFTRVFAEDQSPRILTLGGQTRRELTREVTHLICMSESGRKYESAMKTRVFAEDQSPRKYRSRCRRRRASCRQSRDTACAYASQDC